LNFVSFHFLKDRKEDVPHQSIASLFFGSKPERTRLAKYCLKDTLLPIQILVKLSMMVCRCLSVPVLCDSVLSALCSLLCALCEGLCLCFCGSLTPTSSLLSPLPLFPSSSSFFQVNLIEMGRVTGVLLNELISRGQQYKCFSQIARQTRKPISLLLFLFSHISLLLFSLLCLFSVLLLFFFLFLL
jgi:hypothetical protein